MNIEFFQGVNFYEVLPNLKPYHWIDKALCYRFLHELYINGRLDPIKHTFPLFRGCCPFHSFDENLWLVWDVPEVYLPSTVKAVSVDDTGAKARVITEGQPEIISLLHILRLFMFQVFGSDHECGSLSGEGKSDAFVNNLNRSFERFGFPKGYLLMSLDLSRATDTFLIRLCYELGRGLVEGVQDIRFRKLLELLSCLAFTPYRVEYTQIKGFPRLDPIDSLRGELMGNPPSWPLLNLYLRYHWQWSAVLYDLGFSKDDLPNCLNDERSIGAFQRYEVVDDPLTQRCGDDQISLSNERRIHLFHALMILSGAIPSPGVNSISSEYGVFTEALIKVVENQDNSKKSKASFIDIYRCSSLTSKAMISRLPGMKEIPESWSRGVASSNALRWLPSNQVSLYRGLSRWVIWQNTELFSFCIKLGLPVYVPRELGGMSFLHPMKKGFFHTPPRILRFISILLNANYNPVHLFQMKLCSEMWNPELSTGWRTYFNPILSLVCKCIEIANLPIDHFEEKLFRKGVYFDWNVLLRLNLVTAQASWLHKPTMKGIQDFAKNLGFLPFPEFMDSVIKMFEDKGAFSLKEIASSIQRVPTLAKISKRYNKRVQEILESDHFNYEFDKNWSPQDLLQKVYWKFNTYFINAKLINLIYISFWSSSLSFLPKPTIVQSERREVPNIPLPEGKFYSFPNVRQLTNNSKFLLFFSAVLLGTLSSLK